MNLIIACKNIIIYSVRIYLLKFYGLAFFTCSE